MKDVVSRDGVSTTLMVLITNTQGYYKTKMARWLRFLSLKIGTYYFDATIGLSANFVFVSG